VVLEVCAVMVSAAAQQGVDRYLAHVDGLLEGILTGFYLVGSIAPGSYRPARSDIDFVALLSTDLDRSQLRRLRMAHLRRGVWTATRAMRAGRSPLTGTLNGVFIREGDLRRPVTEIVPVASQVGEHFFIGRAGSDVSPVAWKVLVERGIAIRGPDPDSLGLNTEPGRLRSWTARNLEDYWRPWAATVTGRPTCRFVLRPRWSTAWGVLGVSRLHCTITTGGVISKQAAAEYACSHFSERWRPLITEALDYWCEQPDRLALPVRERAKLTADFVNEIIDDGLRCSLHEHDR
jgi:Domain of unknown function (DUF4111)